MGRFGRIVERFRSGAGRPSSAPAGGRAHPTDSSSRRPDTSARQPVDTHRAPDQHSADRTVHRVEPDAELSEVTIAYSPMLDGDPDPGEVVWTWVQFEDDPTQGKDRPVVIIGRRGSQLAAVQLTTKPHPERHDEIPVGVGSWDSEGRLSYAKLERILTVDPDGVRREGAILDRRRFDEVVNALRTFHGIKLP